MREYDNRLLGDCTYRDFQPSCLHLLVLERSRSLSFLKRLIWPLQELV